MIDKKVIVVLGMHRSGTSAIARGLQALSIDLGDNLMPGAAGDNDKGFWEDLDIYALNERLLAKIGSAWDRLAPIDAEIYLRDDFAQERYDAARLIKQKLSRTGTFGFKDPRTSITLPFWQCIFDDLSIEDRYVLAVRNPLEVAQSLLQRNGIEAVYSVTMWLKYNWSALTLVSERPLACISYDNLIRSPLEELGRMAERLELPAPQSNNPAVMEYIGDFLSPWLRRHAIPDQELVRASWAPQAVQSLYEELTRWAASDVAPTPSSKLKSQIASFFAATQPFLDITDRQRVIARAREESLRNLIAARDSAEAEADALNARVTQLQDYADAAAAELSELRPAFEITAAQRAELSATAQQALNELEELRQSQEVLAEQLQSANTENESVYNSVAALEEEIAGLRSESEMLRCATAELEELTILRELLSERVEQQDTELEYFRSRNADLEQDNEALRVKASDLLKESEKLRAESGELKISEASGRQKIENLLEELVASRETAVSAQQAATALQSSDTAIRQELAEYQRQLVATRSELKARTAERDALAQSEAIANDQLMSMKEDLIRKANQQGQAKVELNKMQEELNSHRELLNKALNTLSERDAKLVDADQRQRQLEAQATQLAGIQNNKIRDLTARIAELEVGQHLKEADFAKREEQIAALKVETVGLQMEVADLQAQIMSLYKDLRLSRAEVVALKSSTSWKITRPVRATRTILTDARTILKKMLRLSGPNR